MNDICKIRGHVRKEGTLLYPTESGKVYCVCGRCGNGYEQNEEVRRLKFLPRRGYTRRGKGAVISMTTLFVFLFSIVSPVFAQNIVDERVDEVLEDVKVGAFQRNYIGVNLESIRQITKGVQVEVKAWANDGRQIGFSPDGSVEIERINIYNPPTLVPDEDGEVLRESYDELTGQTIIRKYRYDPEAALQQVIVDTIKIIGKEGADIESGKVGRTTSVFYPDPHPESVTWDGNVNYDGSQLTFSSIRSASGTGGNDDGTDITMLIMNGATSSNFKRMDRGIALFPTASLDDTTDISSVTLSFVATGKNNGLSGESNDGSKIHVVAATTSSNTAYTASDYQNIGGTSFGASANQATTSTSVYNDISLDSNGIANVSKTAVSKFGFRLGWDLSNTAPNYVSNEVFQRHSMLSADNSGTTQDIKLTVEHHTVICGDGLIEEDEECDDGNDDGGDGCSALCTVEDGWSCVGEPSECEEEASSSSSSSAVSSSSSSLSLPSATGSYLPFTRDICQSDTYVYNASGAIVGGYCDDYVTYIYDYPVYFFLKSVVTIAFASMMFGFGLLIVIWGLYRLWIYIYCTMYDKAPK